MTDRQKQIAYLVGGLLVTGIILLFIYSYFLSGTKTATPTGALPRTTGTPSLPISVPVRNNGATTTGDGTAYEPTLFQIHDKPIVSFVVFTRDGFSYARFIEQGSGHVYEYNFDSKQKIRISNTSIPQIETAAWSKDGNTVAFQYLENGTVKSAIGDLATTSTESSYKKITFLPDGLGDVALSPNGTQIAYTTKTQNGGVVVVAGKDGTKAHSVFSSPLMRWFVSWPSDDSLIIETPLSLEGGAAYSVNVKSGAQKSLLVTEGPFEGLVGASDGINYLYTPAWANGTTRYNSKDNTEFALFAMNTLPEKCSFIATSSSNYALCGSGSSASNPILTHFEEWLRGEGYAEDSIYLVNFFRGAWTPVIRSQDQGDRTFDVEHIEGDTRTLYAAFKEHEGGILLGIWLRPGLFF